jgi:hypothetical protein
MSIRRGAAVLPAAIEDSNPLEGQGDGKIPRMLNAVLQLVLLRRTGRSVIGWSARRREGRFWAIGALG